MKQTAVDWLVEQICGDHTEQWQKEIEQAKEMEKEQMRQASCPYVGGWEEGEFEDWYNETYKQL